LVFRGNKDQMPSSESSFRLIFKHFFTYGASKDKVTLAKILFHELPVKAVEVERNNEIIPKRVVKNTIL